MRSRPDRSRSIRRRKSWPTLMKKNAQAKEDVADTKKSLSADEQFLMMLKEKCSMTDSEWEERQKTRQLEMEACSKALAVLSSDDAHDLFTKTFNPAFVQKESSMHSERRSQASKLLSAVAQKHQNPRLATLAGLRRHWIHHLCIHIVFQPRSPKCA